MRLEARITDIDGFHLATINQHEGIEVTWPLNDSRTARVVVSIYDDCLAHVRPLDRLLYIEYGPYLLFSGYIVKPVWQAGAKVVEINAHDATLKLKHHYHRYGDLAVDVGYPADGKGVRRLITDSVPNINQLSRAIPGNGILWGHDTTTHQGPKPVGAPGPDDPMWGKAERGSNIWDTVINLSQSAIGLDFEFEPIDLEHPPISGVYSPGFLAQLHTADKLQVDRSGDVQFHYGFGADNAEDFTYEPDGDAVRNYWVEVNPGGQRSRADQNRALRHNEESWLRYGIYGGWESAGQKWPIPVLAARAKQWVNAYAFPPDFFTVDPRPDAAGVPRLIGDYTVGDLISAAARVGRLSIEVVGRVVEARVTQASKAGGANVSLACVPDIDVADSIPGDEGVN